MPDETAVQMARRGFANHSRSQLIEVIRDPIRQGAERTAAQQLIDEMDQRNHEDLIARLDELKKPHWSVPWTFWVALTGVIIAACAWLSPNTPNEKKAESDVLLPTVQEAQEFQPVHKEEPAPAATPLPPIKGHDSIPAKQPSIEPKLQG